MAEITLTALVDAIVEAVDAAISRGDEPDADRIRAAVLGRYPDTQEALLRLAFQRAAERLRSDNEVQVATKHASVGDLIAHADLALQKARRAKDPRLIAEAQQRKAAAAEALRRAGGDPTVMIRDIADPWPRTIH